MDIVSTLMNGEPNPRNQNFCCVSLLSPTTPNQKFPQRMINIRSPFFHNNPAAVQYAKYLKSIYVDTDRDFDIYVVPMGKWIPWPDNSTTNVSLEDMMQHRVSECQEKDAEFAKRKRELLKGGDVEPDMFESNVIEPIEPIGAEESKGLGGKMLLDDKIEERKYFVISFLTDEENGMYGFKVSGIYDEETKATERIEEIQKYNKYLNVYIGQVGRWQEWEPDFDKCLEQHWGNEKVETFMHDFEENQKKVAERRQSEA